MYFAEHIYIAVLSGMVVGIALGLTMMLGMAKNGHIRLTDED